MAITPSHKLASQLPTIPCRAPRSDPRQESLGLLMKSDFKYTELIFKCREKANNNPGAGRPANE